MQNKKMQNKLNIESDIHTECETTDVTLNL